MTILHRSHKQLIDISPFDGRRGPPKSVNRFFNSSIYIQSLSFAISTLWSSVPVYCSGALTAHKHTERFADSRHSSSRLLTHSPVGQYNANMKKNNKALIGKSKAITLLLLSVVIGLYWGGCKQSTVSQNDNSVDSAVVDPPTFSWQTEDYCSKSNGTVSIETRCSYKVATTGLPADELFRIYQPDETPPSGTGQPSFLVVVVGMIEGVGPLSTNDAIRDYIRSRWPQQPASEDNTEISDIIIGGLAGKRLDFADRAALDNHATQVYLNGSDNSVYYVFANFQSSSEEGLSAYRDEFANILERIVW